MSSILLIDDDHSVSGVCKKVLQSLGHQVVSSQNASDFLSISSQPSVRLVVINACQETGREIDTFSQLRLRLPALNGILIAPENDCKLVVKALNAGMSKVCIKPLDPDEFSQAVIDIFNTADVQTEVTRLKALMPLYLLGQKLLQAQDEEAIYHELADLIVKEFKVPAVSVMMFDEQLGSLKIVAHRGIEEQYVNEQILPGERIAGQVFKRNIPAILNRDRQNDSAYKNLLDRPELSASVSFPLASKNKVVGVINISETKNGRRFAESDVEMLSIISDLALMALGNIKAIRAREEQARIRALLEQYVSPEVSKMIVESRQDLMDVGGIQELTVLFADIRNFTLLVQEISPKELREFLNQFFDMFTSTVFAHKGMLDKFMGDAGLVVFGAPVSLEKPTSSAVNFAAELVSRFQELQDYWSGMNPVFAKISLGVGVSRGPLFLGNIGSQKRIDYTVIGTEVNLAQRLASETNVGQVLLTESAYADLQGAFSFTPLGAMLLRGMNKTVNVYKMNIS